MKVELNPAQIKAVNHKDGPLLIIAGAGAGKTKTLTERINKLIENGVTPNRILAITFTNKAAKEMESRIKEGTNVVVKTFHGLCVSILRHHGDKIGIKKTFTILDDQDSRASIKSSMKDLGLDTNADDIRRIRNTISRQKNELVDVDEYKKNNKSYAVENNAKIWKYYDKKNHAANSLDFDDLLVKAIELFKKHKDVLSYYQEHFQYIHVDEYQDTNHSQYTLASMLADKHKNICVVGDSDQNIYSWRGADIRNILDFAHDFPGAKEIYLEENYRSSGTILSAANTIIEKNTLRKPKNLFSKKSLGEAIEITRTPTGRSEAEYVKDEVFFLLNEGVRPEEIAILYRSNFQSRLIEEVMIKNNVPYHITGVRFFARKEIKDMISYVIAAVDGSVLAKARIINTPTRGIGKIVAGKYFSNKDTLSPSQLLKIQIFEKILVDIRSEIPKQKPSELLKFVAKRSGFEYSFNTNNEEDRERLANIKELITYATKYDQTENGLRIMLDDISLYSDQDSLSSAPKDAVRLMTIHAAKGLEYRYVFIVGLEQGLFPQNTNMNEPIELQEESRRLMYVAVTRAREKLFLSYASMRIIYGQTEIHEPSEFLFDIKNENVNWNEFNEGTQEYLVID